jgi:hypothetical protein
MSEATAAPAGQERIDGQTDKISYPEAFAYVLLSIGARHHPTGQTEVFAALPAPVMQAIRPHFPESYYESSGSNLMYIFLDREVVERGLADWVSGAGIRLTETGEKLLATALDEHAANPNKFGLTDAILESIPVRGKHVAAS